MPRVHAPLCYICSSHSYDHRSCIRDLITLVISMKKPPPTDTHIINIILLGECYQKKAYCHVSYNSCTNFISGLITQMQTQAQTHKHTPSNCMKRLVLNTFLALATSASVTCVQMCFLPEHHHIDRA